MSRKIEVGDMMLVVKSDTYPERNDQHGRVSEVAVWMAEDCVVTSIWLDFTPPNSLPRLENSVEFRLYHGPGAAGRDVNILETFYDA